MSYTPRASIQRLLAQFDPEKGRKEAELVAKSVLASARVASRNRDNQIAARKKKSISPSPPPIKKVGPKPLQITGEQVEEWLRLRESGVHSVVAAQRLGLSEARLFKARKFHQSSIIKSSIP